MVDDPVAAQYARHPYPAAAPGLDRLLGVNDPTTFHALYWPDTPRRPDLEVLVAGCGTVEAVALARRNPRARVVGIDVSGPALQQQGRLARTNGVVNLELLECPVEEVHRLERTFDFISVAGVLHHLADPTAGLRALGGVLRKRGVISGAVYAHHARAGLQAVQATLRAMGMATPTDDEDEAALAQRLATARQVIAALPAHHPVAGWLARTGERGVQDAHLIDAWLPAREAAFDVPGVLSMVEDAGLAFQGWMHNQPYHPDGLFPLGTPAYAALDGLPPAEMWAACARVSAPLDHWFIACRADRPGRWRLDLESDDLLDWTAGRRFPATMTRPPLPYDPRDPLQEALYRPIDGRRTLREVLVAAGLQGEARGQAMLLQRFVRHLWRNDAIYLTVPPS